MNTKKNVWLVVAMMVLLVSAPVWADVYWTNSAGGNASTAANWSTGVAPGVWVNQGDMYFTNNGTYQVTWNNIYVDSLLYNTTSGTITQNITTLLEVYNINGFPAGFVVGDANGSTSTVVQTGAGQLYAPSVKIGNNGQGTFIATGPTLVTPAGALVIGNNTGSAGSSVLVTNGAFVNAAGNGTFIGNNSAGASNNTLTITGSSTVFSNNYQFYIGYLGGGNTVRLEQGAHLGSLGSYFTYIGALASSSNNTVIVTDPGTEMSLSYTSGDFRLGNSGGGNSLFVGNSAVFTNLSDYQYIGTFSAGNQVLLSGGGKMVSTGTSGLTYIGHDVSASNNMVTVTDANSLWNINGADFRVGNSGANNSLIISNGAAAQFNGANAYVGTFNNSNSVIVTGSGSTFSNANATFHIGYQGWNNQLVVSQGGGFASSNLFLAYNGGLTNSVTVDGVNSRVDVGDTLLLNNTTATLTITNGGAVTAKQFSLYGRLNLVGGSLETRGSTVGANPVVVGGGPDSATWTMLGGSHSLNVLDAGNNGTLIVTNGAQLQTSQFIEGYNGYTTAAGSNGLAVVSGSGSTWSNTSSMIVGYSGAGNALRVENGGRVVQSAALDLGYFTAAASNSTVLVTGTNSYFEVGTASGYLQIGQGAHNNSVIVSNGGSLRVLRPLYVGGTSAPITTNNNLTVTGAGSVVSNTSTIAVGYTGGGNTLRIENGGRVVSGNYLLMGQTATSSNNQVVVAGANSVLDVSAATLYLGYVGRGNSVLLTNGGLLLTAGAHLGGDSGSSVGGNTLIASGAGTSWTNTGVLHIGSVGGNNTVRIENGATVLSLGTTTAFIGDTSAASSNNTIMVTGTNSYWRSTANNFQFGRYSANNSLIVSNGGKVQLDGGSSYQLVGTVGSGGNSFKITGPGSSLYWTNTLFDTAIGYQAPNNSVLIENGGQMYSFASSGAARLMVGEFASSSGNAITVTGSNSLWKILANPANTLSEFSFGNASSGNSMVISNGGHVQYDGKYFEIGTFAGTNLVTVTGTGSVFSNVNANFYTGLQGLNNRLRIDNGAEFYGFNMIVGQPGYTGNGIDVRSGGLLDANLYSVYNNNYVTNFGGIFQFSSGTPTLTVNPAMILTNGTISYRDVTDANIFNSQVANIVFQGQNTFRLNGASNNNNVASQNYTFTTNGPASTYARLELINGNTAYRGGNITIGSGGSMLLSNTQATVTGIFTNLGTVTSINAQTMFAGAVYNNGTWVTDPTTQTFASAYTVGTGGTIVMTPGDLMIFSNDFVNQSTQSNAYNTADGKFLFAGTATTQQFYTAGRDLGPGPTPSNPTNVLAAVGGFTANFALGTLEIANFSTVRVSDVTLSLLPDNGQRAGLYLNNLLLGLNSYLIVDTNVSVYYYGASGLTGASFLLLGDGELHQLVTPEPSLLLLLISGGAILSYARRKKA